jgi:hypothetical protein
MTIKSGYVNLTLLPSMLEISSGPCLLPSHHTNTPFKEQLKILIWVVLTLFPLLPRESLEFREELYDPV